METELTQKALDIIEKIAESKSIMYKHIPIFKAADALINPLNKTE